MIRRPNTHSARRRLRRRSGFASFVAVALMGTTAIALTAIAGVTVRQMQRSNHAAVDAQLRLMLMDGRAYLTDPPTETDGVREQYIVLPDPDEAIGSILIEESVAPSVPATATITATLRQRTATATLTYNRDAQRWTINHTALP
ncbi:hypothetical protein OT109_01525 [Phycisphaeraceae bacterium D3-23]